MKLDLTVHKGHADKPTVIFIHGLGMDKRIWVKPDDARILGGSFPLKFLLSKKPEPIDYGSGKKIPKVHHSRFSTGETKEVLKTSFADLQLSGYTVLAWSQKRPAGPIDIAISELKEIIELSKGYSKAGAIFIGHSRGGLIARKYLGYNDKSIKGLITLATPHHGSNIAKWAQYISPLASAISSLIHEEDKKKFSYAIKRILDFIGSKAIKELLPDSEFFHLLRDHDYDRIPRLSFGGTSPGLFSVYRWRLKVIAKRGNFKWLLEPEAIFSIPDILEKIIPKKLYPAEWRNGYGDGLVSAKSSILPQCKEHYNFDVNHAAILFEESVRRKVIKTVGVMCSNL